MGMDGLFSRWVLLSHPLPWKIAESTTDKCITDPWVHGPRDCFYF